MVQCNVTIPGIGQCEIDEGDHEEDGHGRLVHVKGAVKWNGTMTESMYKAVCMNNERGVSID